MGEIDGRPDAIDIERSADIAAVLMRVRALVEHLKPVDRNVLLLHLEGVAAAEIAEIVGISPAYVAQKIHRVQKHLQRHFNDRSGS